MEALILHKAVAEPFLHKAVAEPYFAEFSPKHNGWCVFRRKGDLFVEFHAGAFHERATAQSEAKRLNDLAPNGTGE